MSDETLPMDQILKDTYDEINDRINIKSFKYSLIEQNENEIAIVFDYTVDGFETDSNIETIHPFTNVIISKKDYLVSFDDDENMGKVTPNILSYLNRINYDISKIHIISYSSEIDFLLTDKLLTAVSKKTSSIDIDLLSMSIAIGTDDLIFENINLISGKLLLNDINCTLVTDNLIVKDITVYNVTGNNKTYSLNIITKKSIDIFRIMLYSSSKLVFLNNSKDYGIYKDVTLSLNSISVYGQEYYTDDKESSRLKINGINRVFIDNISIGNEVKYKNIIEVSNCSKVFIGSYNRNIDMIDTGAQFTIIDVGFVNITDINILISENSFLKTESNIFNYMCTNPEIESKLLISNSNIVNNSDAIINLFSCNVKKQIPNIQLSNIYLSNNVNILNDDEITINKLSFSNITINKDALTINNIYELNIDKCTFNIDNLNINVEKLNIIDSTFNSKNIVVEHDNLFKCVASKASFNTDNLRIECLNEESQPSSYLKNSTFTINKEFIINNITPSISDSYFIVNKFNVSNKTYCKFNQLYIGNTELLKEITFDIQTSFNGNIINEMLTGSKCIFTINDSNGYFVRDKLTIMDKGDVGKELDITSNYPIEFEAMDIQTDILFIDLQKSDMLDEYPCIYSTNNSNQAIILKPNKDYVMSEIESSDTTRKFISEKK